MRAADGSGGVEGKDGSEREGWKRKGKMEVEGKDGSGRKGWKRKGSMTAGGTSSPLKMKRSLMKR